MNAPLTDAQRTKLSAQRADLEDQIRALQLNPLTSNSDAARRFRQEDLIALAKKVKGVDKKLGREGTWSA